MERNNNIDLLRGVATLAVIIGHSIQRGLGILGDNYIDNTFFRMIYTFHMPLFMLISGYTLKNYTKEYNFEFLKKRIYRLVIPTISWSYLIWLLRNYNFVGIKEFIAFPSDFIEYSKVLIRNPDFIIWFLYIVLICDMSYFVINKITNKKDLAFQLLLTILFYLLIHLIKNSDYGLFRLKIYYPIFSFGYYSCYLSKHYKNFSLKKLIIAIIVYLLLFQIFDITLNNLPVYYLISIVAIYILYQLITKLNNTYIKKILIYFGQHSLEFYLCQCLCLNIGLGRGYVRVTTILISCTIISFLLSIIISRIPVIRFILFGYRSNKKKSTYYT